MLKLVLPKGSLEKATLELFDAADLAVQRSSTVDYKATIADPRVTDVRILRPQEIPTYVADGLFEVVLAVTVTCQLADKTVYLAEVHQAGLFGLGGFDDRTLDMMLGTYCPNVLFPYVRQGISDLVVQGGFPPFYLQPINFEALYAEGLRRRAEQAQGGAIQAPEAGNA